MGSKFQVAIHYNLDYGYIEYDPETKTAKVILDDSAKAREVQTYLNTKQQMQVPNQTLHDFSPREFKPTDSLDALKLALTRLWERTEVLVDWSRPVDYPMGK